MNLCQKFLYLGISLKNLVPIASLLIFLLVIVIAIQIDAAKFQKSEGKKSIYKLAYELRRGIVRTAAGKSTNDVRM